MDFEDLDIDRVKDWKEENPELTEEHKEELFDLTVAASADQMEHLAEKLEQIASDMRDEVNKLDKVLEEGENQ
jgi:hypothetical protein